MKHRTIFEAGFSLFETVVATFLVGLLVTGMLMLWELVLTRETVFTQTNQAKMNLAVAYEITARSLRGQAKRTSLRVLPEQTGINFIGQDQQEWSFRQVGQDYLKIHDGRSEVLLVGNCAKVWFKVEQDQVRVSLTLINNARLEGLVKVRNP